MLSTTHRYLDGYETYFFSKNGRRLRTWAHPHDADEGGSILYRSTMINHPCTVWTRMSIRNYLWHCEHALELCREYTRRYDRQHGSEVVIRWCSENIPNKLPFGSETPFAQAMPIQYKNECAIQAYRNYYIGDKVRIAKWSRSEIPHWWPAKNISENDSYLLTSA